MEPTPSKSTLPGTLGQAQEWMETPPDHLLTLTGLASLVATIGLGFFTLFVWWLFGFGLIPLFLFLVTLGTGVITVAALGNVPTRRQARKAREDQELKDARAHTLDTLGRPGALPLEMKDKELEHLHVQLDGQRQQLEIQRDFALVLTELRGKLELESKQVEMKGQMDQVERQLDHLSMEAERSRSYHSGQNRKQRRHELKLDQQRAQSRLDELNQQLSHDLTALILQLEEKRRVDPSERTSELLGASKLVRDEMERIAADKGLGIEAKKRQLKFLQEMFHRLVSDA